MRLIRAISIVLCLAACPCWGWGPTGHTLIVEHAIQLLPPEMKPFYDANSRYVVALVMLPDDWRLTHKGLLDSHHYINLDLLDQPPFTKLMENREALGKKMDSEEAAKTGLLPWAIRMRYEKLVKAFKGGDMEDAAVQSALIAHYIGDAHVPLHDTQYRKGKTPEQNGVHFGWENVLVDMFLKPESIKPQSAEKVDDVLKSTLNWCIASYNQVDALLKADDKARELDPVRGYRYHRSLFDQTGPMMIGQISHAAQATAGVWIAAWEQAGKPKLEEKPAPLYWGR